MTEIKSEVRILQKVGSSIALYLPKEWCEHNGLSKGSSVMLKYSDNLLCIDLSRSEGRPSKYVDLDITSISENVLRHLLLSFYIVGYDEVRLISHRRISLPFRRYILSILKYATKYNVVDEGENYLVIGRVSEVEDLLEALKREFNSTMTVFKYTIEALENEAKALDEYYDIMNELDDEVDKAQVEVERAAYKLVERPLLNEKLKFVIPATIISTHLERLSDHLVLLIKEVSRDSSDRSKLISYLRDFSNQFKDLFDVFTNVVKGKYNEFNASALNKLVRVVDSKRVVREELSKTLYGVGNELLVYHIIRIYALMSDIAEVLINMLTMIYPRTTHESTHGLKPTSK